MEIGSDIVGIRLKEYKTSVTWRQTTNYAASVGDMNPHYFDDRRPGGITAPPMFAVAVSWPVQQNISQYMEMPYPMEVFLTMVHHTEYIEFYRPILPGDSLCIKGEVAAVIPHRSGTRIVFKFPVTDPTGVPYHTEYIGALLRGVGCRDSGRGVENIPMTPAPGNKNALTSPTGSINETSSVEDNATVNANESLWEEQIHISSEAPYVYDGCTNIVFPIHTSPAFASSVGLPGIILQGTATLAHAVRQLINREAGGDPRRLEVVCGRFSGMVTPDSNITVVLQKKEAAGGAIHLYYTVINGQGRPAISRGYARLMAN